MITLYLVGVNPAKRGGAIRAVKAALVAAGMPDSMTTMDSAEAAVYHVLSQRGVRGLVAEQEGVCTREQVEAAAIAFSNAVGDSECALAETRESDPSDPQADPVVDPALSPEQTFAAAEDRALPTLGGDNTRSQHEDAILAQFVEPIPDDWTPSREACTTLALIMGMCDGNAQASFVYAKRLAITTGNPQLYVDVGRLVCLAYGLQPVRLA